MKSLFHLTLVACLLATLSGCGTRNVARPFNGDTLAGWATQEGAGSWTVGTPVVDPANPKMLLAEPGGDAMINLARKHGDSLDIYSLDRFGDARIELEVMVPKGSNSGIYVMGEYEVQVLDSWGHEELNSGDMGAVYGAAPPPVNASRPPGEWQKYVILWQAPRFDAAGAKTANAVFRKIELNGVVLHENLEMPDATPGGVTGKEAPTGPLMFQGNHGPVAYRNIRVYRLER